MSGKPETGETTTVINCRADDEAWPRVKAALEGGATLWRPPRLAAYFVDRGNSQVGGGSLTPARCRKLERAGVLRHVGVDRYALAARAGADRGGGVRGT